MKSLGKHRCLPYRGISQVMHKHSGGCAHGLAGGVLVLPLTFYLVCNSAPTLYDAGVLKYALMRLHVRTTAWKAAAVPLGWMGFRPVIDGEICDHAKHCRMFSFVDLEA